MTLRLSSIVLLSVLAIGIQPVAAARQKAVITGRVVEVLGPRLISMRDAETGGREIIVFTPRSLSPALTGATVSVEGAFRRLTAAELKQAVTTDSVGEATRARVAERMVLVAASVLATREGEETAEGRIEAPPTEDEPRGVPPAPPVERTVPPGPLAIRASTLVSHLDGFAGQQIRLLNARVVGLLNEQALLVEPATEYLKMMGTRDRILVLIRDRSLSVPADLLVGSVVAIDGVARTLLGVRVTREVPWPDRLGPRDIARLEVRAAVLATSIHTAEGTELTQTRRPVSD